MVKVAQNGQQTRVTVDPQHTGSEVMAALEAHDPTWVRKMRLMPDGTILFQGNGQPIDLALITASREGQGT